MGLCKLEDIKKEPYRREVDPETGEVLEEEVIYLGKLLDLREESRGRLNKWIKKFRSQELPSPFLTCFGGQAKPLRFCAMSKLKIFLKNVLAFQEGEL